MGLGLHLRREIEPPHYLHRNEVEELLAKVKEPYKTLVAVAFFTGARRGELFGLSRDDLRGDILLIQRQVCECPIIQRLESFPA